jgi:hypothetical protein
MRYWGIRRRQPDVTADRAGRHRRGKAGPRQVEEPYSGSARAERADRKGRKGRKGRGGRRGRAQPRDSKGRFLSFSRDRVTITDAEEQAGTAEGRADDRATGWAADRPADPTAGGAPGWAGGRAPGSASGRPGGRAGGRRASKARTGAKGLAANAPGRDGLGRGPDGRFAPDLGAPRVDAGAERSDAYAAGRRGDAGATGTHYTWRDFELSEELPRARPRTRGSPDRPDGRRHCGELEEILYRQWDLAEGDPPPDIVRAVERLADLPQAIKQRLVEGLDAIYVGPGGVPELDDMDYLRGRPLPSGQAAWDICAGAYGDRKIVVGDQPSPTPDVMMHEVGHALDDIDGSADAARAAAGGEHMTTVGAGRWRSDGAEFRTLYDRCVPHLASDFHRQAHDLGRREFFADAFAAIASRQRPALVDMLGGNTRAALDVMLYFNRRYGI